MRVCPKCHARLTRGAHELVHDVAGQRFLLTVSAMNCASCNTNYLDADSAEQGDIDVAGWLVLHGKASGPALRAVRAALGERAQDIAALLGVTAETMSRWETGQRKVDPLAWVTLGSLFLEKHGLPVRARERLSALASPPEQPAVVKLDARRSKPAPTRDPRSPPSPERADVARRSRR